MQINSYSEITPEILDLSRLSEETSQINAELYKKYDVKRGLRDISGQGVLAGLTEIGEIHAYDMVEGKLIPCEGKLFYRGMDIEELVRGFVSEGRFGFEEITYLLLFGELPLPNISLYSPITSAAPSRASGTCRSHTCRRQPWRLHRR